MNRILYIVPSRGRPEAARALTEAWKQTAAQADLLFAVDMDDPAADDYAAGVTRGWFEDVTFADTHTMVEALNRAAAHRCYAYTHIGFMGDDHRPRTMNWDAIMVGRMIEQGALFAYANDLIQGQALPTEVLVDARVVRELGQMAPDTLTHLYVDNYWLALMAGTGRGVYCPDVTIEHEHPIAGKVPWTEGHKRVNEGSMYSRDREAFDAYIAAGHLARDIQRIKEL